MTQPKNCSLLAAAESPPSQSNFELHRPGFADLDIAHGLAHSSNEVRELNSAVEGLRGAGWRLILIAVN